MLIESSRRLVDLAAAAGLSPTELREHLARELDQAARAQARAVTEQDLELFRGDPGFVGPQPQTMSAAGRERWTGRKRV